MDSIRACNLSLNGALWGPRQSPAAVLESDPNASGLPVPRLSVRLSSNPTHCFLPWIIPAFSVVEHGRYKVKNWNPHSGHRQRKWILILPRETFFPSEQGHPLGRSERTRSRVFPLSTLTNVSQALGHGIFGSFCLFPPYWGKYILHSQEQAPSLPDPTPNSKGKQLSNVSEEKEKTKKQI